MKTVQQFINEEIAKLVENELGYKEFELKTHLKDDLDEIHRAIVKLDKLNRKLVSVEYKAGVFEASKNYNDRLYIREILSEKEC